MTVDASFQVMIIIPGEPAAKGRGRVGKTRDGRAIVFTPQKTRTKEGVVASLGIVAMAGREPYQGPMGITIVATLGVPASWSKKRRALALSGDELPAKRPDLDNLLKLASDGLNGIVFRDDAQLVSINAVKVYGLRPRTEITVRGIPCFTS